MPSTINLVAKLASARLLDLDFIVAVMVYLTKVCLGVLKVLVNWRPG